MNIPALVASGALDFQTAVALVQKRGKFMANAAPRGVGKNGRCDEYSG